MNPFLNVLQAPRSIVARRGLALHWRNQGDPRAELIERQLQQHDGLNRLTRDTIPLEIDELIESHGREWAGRIAELTNDYGFELGLIAGISINGDKFVQHAAELVRLAPIVHVSVDPPIDLVALSATPALAQISTLSVGGGPWLNDDAVIEFARSPYIRGLRAIDFADGHIGERGLQALGASPHLRDVAYIDLTNNPCSATGAEGVRGMTIMDSYYLVGDVGLPYLQEAYDAAAVSYDPGGIHNWPPNRKRLAYSE